jgi:hypothetical protein
MSELLRYWAFKLCGKGEQEDAASDVMTAAANEIERLREALQHAEAAMEGMASDQLTAVETANLWNATMESIRAALEVKP